MDLPKALGRMAGPPSRPLPAGDAMGDGTPEVVGDKSCRNTSRLCTAAVLGQD